MIKWMEKKIKFPKLIKDLHIPGPVEGILKIVKDLFHPESMRL